MDSTGTVEFAELKKDKFLRLSLNSLRELNPDNVLQRLNECGLSCKGSLSEWCERLLRFRLRTTNSKMDVPWCMTQDVRQEDDLEITEVPTSIMSEYRVYMKRLEQRSGSSRKKRSGSVSSLASRVSQSSVSDEDGVSSENESWDESSKCSHESENEELDHLIAEGNRLPSGSPCLHIKRKMRVMQILQAWKLEFSGEEKVQSLEFVLRLEECMRCMELSERDVLDVLPCILSRSASRWYRLRRSEIRCWDEFTSAFRYRFFKNLRDEDLIEDLKLRTQDEDESISEFLESFRLIVEHFLKPPSERAQVRQALRNLHPKYRHYMEGRIINSLRTLEEYGRMFERRRELDRCYRPPPPKEAMRIPDAAPKNCSGKCIDESSSCESNPSSECNSSLSMDELSEKAVQNDCNLNEGVKRPRKRNRKRRKKNLTLGGPEVLECAAVEFAGASGLKPSSGPDPLVGRIVYPTSRVQVQTGLGFLRPFSLGPCFVCNLMGHRAAECPQRICRECLGMGHHAVECPKRVAGRTDLRCQVCGMVGSTFWSCVRCESTRIRMNESVVSTEATPGRNTAEIVSVEVCNSVLREWE